MTNARKIFAAALLIVPGVASAMDISAKAAVIIDGGSGRVLWSRNAEASMFPASTTKIMTGLLLIEHCLPTDVITAPADVETVKESSMHLKPLERVSAKDMLYALLLRSANDGAYTIAMHISGSVPAFADLMNARAREIGCVNTHFHNPNGLNDPLHTTCAYDLAMIAREAMKYEPFRDVVRTQKYTIDRSINTKDTHMVNRDKWLAKDATAEGVKTGYTVPAGHCFVGAASRNGFRVITVVMKSANWQKDNQQMVDWAFKNFEEKQQIRKGQPLGQMNIGAVSVPVVAKNDASFVAKKGDTIRSTLQPTCNLPVQQGQEIGQMVLEDSHGYTEKVPVLAGADAAASVPAKAVVQSTPWTVAIGGLLFVGAFIAKGKARRFIGRI